MRPTLIVRFWPGGIHFADCYVWKYIAAELEKRISVTKINMAEAVGSNINGNMMNDNLSLEKEITRSVFNFIVVRPD